MMGQKRLLGLAERIWLKEAAQAEREGKGLSGGRCSITDLIAPTSSFSLVHSTNQRSTESSENQLKNRYLLVTSLFLFYPLLSALFQSPYPPDLICPTKLHPYPFMPASLRALPCGLSQLLLDHLALWFIIV